MLSYLSSVFSLKKILFKNVSIFALWDGRSSFTKNSEIRRFSKLLNSKIGKYSRVNPGCKLANVTVGNFTAIGRDSTIGLGMHPTNYISSQNIFYQNNNMNNRWVKSIDFPTKNIKIGSDVWIGAEAMILDGVKIGNGAVIGARAVVTKDVPSYAIVVGMPAKIIKYRFSKEIINKLNETEWWELNDEEIDDKIELFRSNEITIELLDKFLDKK